MRTHRDTHRKPTEVIELNSADVVRLINADHGSARVIAVDVRTPTGHVVTLLNHGNFLGSLPGETAWFFKRMQANGRETVRGYKLRDFVIPQAVTA